MKGQRYACGLILSCGIMCKHCIQHWKTRWVISMSSYSNTPTVHDLLGYTLHIDVNITYVRNCFTLYTRILEANASELWLIETCVSDNQIMQTYVCAVTRFWWLVQGSLINFLHFLLLWVITWWKTALEILNLVSHVLTWWRTFVQKLIHVTLIASDVQ